MCFICLFYCDNCAFLLFSFVIEYGNFIFFSQRSSDNNNIDHKYDENDSDSDKLVECTSDKLINLACAINDTDNAHHKQSEPNSGDLINNINEPNSDNNIETKQGTEEVTRNRAIEQAHDFILKIFSDQCDIENTAATAITSEQFQLPKYEFAFQEMTSSTGTATQMNTTTTSTAKNSINFHNNNNCSNNNSNTKLDNILKRLTGKYCDCIASS